MKLFREFPGSITWQKFNIITLWWYCTDSTSRPLTSRNAGWGNSLLIRPQLRQRCFACCRRILRECGLLMQVDTVSASDRSLVKPCVLGYIPESDEWAADMKPLIQRLKGAVSVGKEKEEKSKSRNQSHVLPTASSFPIRLLFFLLIFSYFSVMLFWAP